MAPRSQQRRRRRHPEATQTPQQPESTPDPNAQPDYDSDGDGLIEINNLEQLDATRYDPDCDGVPLDTEDLDGDGYDDFVFYGTSASRFPPPQEDLYAAVAGAPATSCPAPWISTIRTATPPNRSTPTGHGEEDGRPSCNARAMPEAARERSP